MSFYSFSNFEPEVSSNSMKISASPMTEWSRAQNYFQAGMEALEDIDRACGEKKSDKPLTNMANTMTDRCIVNKAETNMRNEKLEEVAQRVGEEEGPLEEFFYCLHFLDQFQTSADKVINTYEQEEGHSSAGAYNRRGESSTHGMLRKVSKLFYKIALAIHSRSIPTLRRRLSKGLPSTLVNYLEIAAI